MSGQLGLEGMPTRLVKVTPSRLATWDDCRRRYRMAYVDRPTPPRGGAWAHSTLGAVVHNALRALFELPPARRDPERAASLLSTHWSDEGFRDCTQAAQYRERARAWVSDYTAEHDDASLARHRMRAEESAAELSAATDTLAAGGREDVLFPPSPGRRCAWCDFRRHCPEGRQAAPALDPWALLAP